MCINIVTYFGMYYIREQVSTCIQTIYILQILLYRSGIFKPSYTKISYPNMIKYQTLWHNLSLGELSTCTFSLCALKHMIFIYLRIVPMQISVHIAIHCISLLRTCLDGTSLTCNGIWSTVRYESNQLCYIVY